MLQQVWVCGLASENSNERTDDEVLVAQHAVRFSPFSGGEEEEKKKSVGRRLANLVPSGI